ncbi:MAG TPA: hypothetical protein VM580_17705, partial [Labilithrix sp.]|nr:hypothetical protein [Labilithrix sp.]
VQVGDGAQRLLGRGRRHALRNATQAPASVPSLGSTMANVMTRAQIGEKGAVFEVPRRSGHLEHDIYTSELWD